MLRGGERGEIIPTYNVPSEVNVGEFLVDVLDGRLHALFCQQGKTRLWVGTRLRQKTPQMMHYLRSALLSLMPSAATFQLTLGQPSELPVANVKRKGSACLQFKLGQQVFSHQKRFITSCV